MSGVLGIVSEYNPFHNGHLHNLEESKKITKTDFCVAVMSGNFVQRGDTALVDKWTRAEMALKNGVDLVVELPTVYAISSAENFADGAIKILNSLGVVDYVSFGSEIGEIKPIDDIAEILYNEPKEFSSLIKSQLRSGLSYPRAREVAISQFFGSSMKYTEIIKNPNNILGVEYLKSIKRQKSSITPITIKRNYSDYNSEDIKNGIASATAIRTMIKNNKKTQKVVPQYSYELIHNSIQEGHVVKDISVFGKEIIYILRRMSIDDIKNLPDVSEGLEFKIKEAASKSNNFDALINEIKSKRYTQSRIQRIFLYALLNITKKDIENSKKLTPYIRVLGFNKHGKRIISAIAAANPKLNIIVSVKKFIESQGNNQLKHMLEKDILATNIYTLAYKKNSISNLDYTKKVIEIK